MHLNVSLECRDAMIEEKEYKHLFWSIPLVSLSLRLEPLQEKNATIVSLGQLFVYDVAYVIASH